MLCRFKVQLQVIDYKLSSLLCETDHNYVDRRTRRTKRSSLECKWSEKLNLMTLCAASPRRARASSRGWTSTVPCLIPSRFVVPAEDVKLVLLRLARKKLAIRYFFPSTNHAHTFLYW